MMRSNQMMLVAVAILLVTAPLGQADVIGYWKLENNLTDSSGGDFDGSYSGSPTYVGGKLGQALSFTASQAERATMPDDPVWDTGNTVSVSHWFKAGSVVSGGKGMVVHDRSNYKYLTYITSDYETLSFYVRTTDSVKAAGYHLPSGDFDDGTWHHFVGVYDRYAADGNRVKMYLDGVRRGTNPGTDHPIAAGDEGIVFGSWGGGSYYNGSLDDIAVFDHPLTQAEIDYVYNGGAGNTLGQSVNWNAATGNWTEDAKWSLGREPYAVDTAYVNNGGTVTINDDQRCRMLRVGWDGTGTVNMTGGSLTQTGPGSGDDMYVGRNGHGEFHQTAGDVYAAKRLRMGDGATAYGLYEISDGTLTVPSTFYLGSHGYGEFRQTGGLVDAKSTIYMAVWSAGATGIYRISDGTLNVAGTLMVSHNGDGQFYQTGGEVNVTSNLQLGYGNTGTGSGLYEISDGLLDVDRSLLVGRNAPGTFHIIGDGATIDVDGYTQKANSTLDLDFLAGGISTINVDGLVSLAGSLDLYLDPLAGTLYRPFTLISNDGSDPVTGTFSNVSEGDEFVVPGFGHLWLSYAGGIGSNDVVLYTPEPATVTLLAIGVLGLLRRRKTR